MNYSELPFASSVLEKAGHAMSQALGRYVALYCGLLMSIGAFSIDISLPAIPAMVRALD